MCAGKIVRVNCVHQNLPLLSKQWFLALVVLLLSTIAPDVSAQTGDGVPVGNPVDSKATTDLMELSRDCSALDTNLDRLLDLSPEALLDDVVLRAEYGKRYSERAEEWPEQHPSSKLQILSWLAEANKRLCFDRPAMRANHRDSILAVVKDQLKSVKDPDVIQSLLNVAQRTVFYGATNVTWVTPRDGADEVIDLFMEYVGHSEPKLHEYARDALRMMGYVYPSRYQDVLSFLISHAPEIEEQLTPTPMGINIDVLSGSDPVRSAREEDWLFVEKATGQALADVARQTLYSHRSLDMLGWRALDVLLQKAREPGGAEALKATANLVKEGFRPSEIVYRLATGAAKTDVSDSNQAAMRSLDVVLGALQDAAKNWPQYQPHSPADVVRNTQKALVDAREKAAADGTQTKSLESSVQVEERLGEAVQRLENVEVTRVREKMPPHRDVSDILRTRSAQGAGDEE